MVRPTIHLSVRLALALNFALAAPLRAEDGPLMSTPEVALPQLPAVPAPPPPQPDRKDGAGAAAAMAAVGAAIAGLSCAMLLKQAEEEPDPSKKAQLQAQAMQQCAQAAQSAANAAQNKDSKDKLAAADSPAKVDLGYIPKEEKTTDKTEAQKLPEYKASAPTQVADTEDETEVPETVFEKDPMFDEDFTPYARAGSTTKLQPIDPGQLQYDDTNKAGSPAFQQSQLPGSTSGMGGGLSGDGLRVLASGSESAIGSSKGKRKAHGEIPEIAGSDGGGDGRSDGKSDSGDMNDMLAKIMGGGAGETMEMGGSQLADISVAPAQNLKTPNLFEYASFRIRKTRKEGGIGRGRVAWAK